MRLRYGTRGSALALAQSAWVAGRLQDLHPGLELEAVRIETSGDRFIGPLERALEAEGGVAPNLKAMFVKEIEEALLRGAIDFAVHSAKDLPAALPPGLGIAAYPPREPPWDVYVGGAAPTLRGLKDGSRVGTSSLRRQIQLRLSFPGARAVPLRGNVDTRLKRLAEGAVDGIVLALAGLRRLERETVPHERIPPELMVPAPGQGALAVEAREDRGDLLRLLSPLDDAGTRAEVECERAFMRAMGGGCRSPLGAWAELGDGRLRMTVFWSDAEGRRPVRLSAARPAGPGAPEALAEELRLGVLEAGGG